MNNVRLNLEKYPSFITTKTYNNYPFFKDIKNAELLMSCIYFGKEEKWYKLISFVLMPDHLHLIIVPDRKNISQALHSIKSFSAKKINSIDNRTGSIWQHSFRDFTISTQNALLEKVTYIHNNPVKKGIVEDPGSYEFSSANPKYKTDISDIL